MICCVLGMHRSGTSAMAGLLHSNGICMGHDDDFYPPPMKENPKGFYENVRFRRINDAILKEQGYRVKSFDPSIPKIHITRNAEYRKLMTRIVEDYCFNYGEWGWKDPRTCLTLLSWLDVFRAMGISSLLRIIIMFREVQDIERSMVKRGNKQKYAGQFIRLAEAYYYAIYNNVKEYRNSLNIMTVTFSDLLENTNSVARRLEPFLNKTITDLSFVDPEISGG